jgi:hypothetical protein
MVEGARGDIAYRYSKFGTIGVAYSFTHFTFRDVFGASDLHDFGLIYSLRLSSTWELRARGGATRVESQILAVVPVNPVVEAITGQTAGVQATYQLNYLPSASLALTKRLPHGSFALNYARGVTPGNGVYLTSASETASASYAYNGIQHWGFAASGGYSRLDGLLQMVGQYRSYYAGAGLTRTLGKGVGLAVRFDERRYDTSSVYFRRDSYRATAGLTWSPGDLPLSLW